MRFADPAEGGHLVAPEGRQTLRIECWSPAGGEREPNHTHPEQASGFEIISGELAFWVLRAGPGETVTVPAATNHRFRNPTAGGSAARLPGSGRPLGARFLTGWRAPAGLEEAAAYRLGPSHSTVKHSLGDARSM